MKYYTSLDLSEHLDKSELKQDTYYYELTLNKKHELKSLNKIFNNETSNASEAEFENVSNYVKTLSQADWTYLEQLEAIIKNGVETENRTDTDTISIFGTQNRYDLSKSFPLLTTKKTVLRNIITELIWFIQGDTNLKYLKDVNNPIWNQWRRPYNLNRDLVKVRTRKENERKITNEDRLACRKDSYGKWCRSLSYRRYIGENYKKRRWRNKNR